jgi:acetolactate synthase-1/2/3 large subunit
MAAGYARASGKVGVCIVTSGPGATNCVTPVRDCMADSIPMVLISGQVARAAIGTDAFQEAPVFSIMSSCAKHVFLVKNEEQLESTIRTAFHIARSGRPGPVVIDLPKDVQNWHGVYKGEGILPLPGYQQRIEALKAAAMPKDKARDFFRMLKKSKRPLLYVGGGVILAEAAGLLRQFMKRYQIPAVTTLTGIGAVDTSDDLAMHMLGMHGTAYANYAVEDCDLLICVGARFDDRVAGLPHRFAEQAVIAQIDIDAAEVGKVKRVDWSHIADAGAALRDLMEYGAEVHTDHPRWLKHLADMKKKHRQDFNRDSDIIQPQAALEILNELTGGRAIITSGVGQHQMFCAQHLDFSEPRTWITSGSMGTMGFGLPAAIGAQYAHPDKLVIDVDGDGSIRMNIGELETCTNYNLPVKVLLLNNRVDGMVVQWQTLYFGERFSGTDKTLHRKDFVKTAEADGFEFARSVSKYEDLRKTMEEFLAFPGPAFLEVMTDRQAFVYPMVGPGQPYKDMLTGPHIESREHGPSEGVLDPSDCF